MRKKQSRAILVGLVCIFVIGVVSVHAQSLGTGRIHDFREEIKADLERIQDPQYVSGVQYLDLLNNPSADELYSYAKDNEAWTAELLETFRQSRADVEELEAYVGDKILFVFIDFETDTPYAATIDLQSGVVEAGYEDTKTEIWADLDFVSALIAYGDNYSEEEAIAYAMEHYYEDWGVWVQKGPIDLMLTREMLWDLLAVAGIMSIGYGAYRMKKRT